MGIRGPYGKLAGCLYLARLVDKVRHQSAGTLPGDFHRYLFHPKGIDGVFLSHFGLTKEEIVDIVQKFRDDDSQIESWFDKRIGSDQRAISDWNDIAINLGRSGYPMAESFPRAKKVAHNCDDPSIDICFKLLDWDEGRLESSPRC